MDGYTTYINYYNNYYNNLYGKKIISKPSKKNINQILRSDKVLIKKLKINGDTDCKVFEILKNI